MHSAHELIVHESFKDILLKLWKILAQEQQRCAAEIHANLRAGSTYDSHVCCSIFSKIMLGVLFFCLFVLISQTHGNWMVTDENNVL